MFGKLIYSLLFILFTPFLLLGQASPAPTEQDTTNKKEVHIIYSDLLENQTDANGERVTKLSGGVQLQQDSVLLFCDTAFKQGNNIIAYGKVAIQQNDSLIIFSDSLVYRGETKVADLFGNVVMDQGTRQLFTDYLNYELEPKIARFVTGGLITQGDTKLESKKGTYFVNTDEMYFKDSITVFDSTFTLRADTLLMNTETQIVTFLGPTLIQQDSNLIYCEDGFYDMDTEYAEFLQNAQYLKGEQKATALTIIYDGSMKEIRLEGAARFEENDKTATADIIRYEEESEDIYLEGNAFFRDSIQEIESEETIRYNSKTESFSTLGRTKVVDESQILEANQLDFDEITGLGRAEGAVFWQDTIEHITIDAHIADYTKESQYIKAYGNRPLLSFLSDSDTLFLASDTLISNQDEGKSDDRLMQSYTDVRIFRNDLQAIADSLSFISKDSIFKLYKEPILWSDTAQFRGDSIFIQMKDGSIDRIFLYNNAFVVTSPDLLFFNQIKGTTITAFFQQDALQRVKVEGNAESIYYVLDKEDAYIGMNQTICSEMLLFFENNSVTNINFYKQPNSSVTPMSKIKDDPPNLTGFTWDFNIRPKSVADLRNPRLSVKRSKINTSNRPSNTPSTPTSKDTRAKGRPNFPTGRN